nr:MAG TPA: hypothetical protein [Caudoviricetes sp.]
MYLRCDMEWENRHKALAAVVLILVVAALVMFN